MHIIAGEMLIIYKGIEVYWNMIRTKMKLRGTNGKKQKEKDYLKNTMIILMTNMLVFNKK